MKKYAYIILLNILLILFFDISVKANPNENPETTIEVNPIETLPGGIYDEIQKGDASGRSVKIEKKQNVQTLSILGNDKVLFSKNISASLVTGAPIWTKNGVWIVFRKTEDFITRTVAISYYDLTLKDPKPNIFDVSSESVNQIEKVINIVQGNDDSVRVICAIKNRINDQTKFVLKTYVKEKMSVMSKEFLGELGFPD